MQLYPEADPEMAAAAVEEELKADEWNLGELERLQQEQVRLQGTAYVLSGATAVFSMLRLGLVLRIALWCSNKPLSPVPNGWTAAYGKEQLELSPASRSEIRSSSDRGDVCGYRCGFRLCSSVAAMEAIE